VTAPTSRSTAGRTCSDRVGGDSSLARALIPGCDDRGPAFSSRQHIVRGSVDAWTDQRPRSAKRRRRSCKTLDRAHVATRSIDARRGQLLPCAPLLRSGRTCIRRSRSR
jgi:hypothetical protein